ncbi:MAG: 50S ribosomal protein L4 [Gemmataceae bacterium]|nr:50S ribosomal protein L4 [Gemmataceae bacterium]
MPPISVPVLNREGAEVGKVEIDPAEFGGKINRQLLHEACLMFLANQRAGTHSTLRRGQVAGSTKKVFRQKGTGNARIGTKRTNKRRGGGTAKGPKPRDYEYHLPKKAVRAATRMALLSKFMDNEAVVIDDLSVGEIKTKPMARFIQALTEKLIPKPARREQVEGKKPPKQPKHKSSWLISTDGIDRNLYLSARNLPDVKVMPSSDLNAYTVLRQKRLVLTRSALEALRKGSPTKKDEPAPQTTQG